MRIRIIFVLLTALLTAAPLLAQYSPCYDAAFKEGQRLYNAGQYTQAKAYFKEAKECPDPNAAAANEWIGKCDSVIAVANANQKKKDEIAAKKKKEQEAAKKAYMNISKVEFANKTKYGTTIDEFGSELYSSDMRYLKPNIKYKALLDENRTVTVDAKIIKPNGVAMRGKESPKDYTYSETFTVFSGYDRTKEISGWGNNDESAFPAGTYGFELWHDGNCFFKTQFVIKPDSERPVYDKQPNSELIKKKVENRINIADLFYDKKEFPKAAEWYRKAAELGSANAQNYLGVMYYDGKGVERDYDEAVKWYRKAANQSHKWGEYNMGRMYEEGRGVGNKDYKMAMEWYQKALNHGEGDEKIKEKAKERLEAVKKLEAERQKELAAEKKRKEEADRKKREEFRIASLKARPWEFRVGAGFAYEMRGINPGNLPVIPNSNPNRVGFGMDLNLFFAARKHLGASDYFVMPSGAASIGHITMPLQGIPTTLDHSPLVIGFLDDYFFPSFSLGKVLSHGDMSIGIGYYMDFIYRIRCSGKYAHEATLPSHYTGGWASVIAYHGDVLGVRALVGFPKAVDCMVEGYNCQIKAPVVILSFNILSDWN